MTAQFVKCPLCGDPERPEDIVGGVCLTCADAIAFSQNARRGAVVVDARTPDERELLFRAASFGRVSAEDIRQAIANLRGPMNRDESIAIGCAYAVLWALEERDA